MSISQVNLRASAAVAALRHTAATTAAASPTMPRQADTVSLSDTARALCSARDAVGQATDVREDRVAAIKAAIADGTYSIDSRQLARSMVKTLSL